MSNRPVKKKKVVDIPVDEMEVDWTPPPRTARDRLIQFGVLFLIIAFLLPMVTCAVTPPQVDPEQQAQQTDEVEREIQRYSRELGENPNDPTTLANLGYYTNLKAARSTEEGERMTLLTTAEKYLRDALAQDSDYAFAQSELAKNLILQEKMEEASTLVSSALEEVEGRLDAENETEANEARAQKVQLLVLSSEVARRQGDLDAALEGINQALELRPGEPQFYLHRAELHKARGDKDAARADYTTVVDIGQKMGNQEMAMVGQLMIQQLDNPGQPLEINPGETPAPASAATPAPESTPVEAATPAAEATPAEAATPAVTATP